MPSLRSSVVHVPAAAPKARASTRAPPFSRVLPKRSTSWTSRLHGLCVSSGTSIVWTLSMDLEASAWEGTTEKVIGDPCTSTPASLTQIL